MKASQISEDQVIATAHEAAVARYWNEKQSDAINLLLGQGVLRDRGRPVGGYSVLRADEVDSAVSLVRDHPFIGRGGSLTVTEAVAP